VGRRWLLVKGGHNLYKRGKDEPDVIVVDRGVSVFGNTGQGALSGVVEVVVENDAMIHLRDDDEEMRKREAIRVLGKRWALLIEAVRGWSIGS